MERVKRYTKEEKIGEGTYAVIYGGKEYSVSLANAKDPIVTDMPPLNAVQERKIAIKRIKIVKDRSGIEMSALREIKHLKSLVSDYIIEILDVFEQDKHIHIVLPYMESNLEVIVRSKKLVFMPQDVKAWMLMICRGLYECHSRYILHRDIKPNNVLISRTGQVKLADFGLATEFGFPVRCMTNQVITRWYKAPELLLGSTNYSFGIDIWALGCLFAELLLRTPYLPGDDDVHQLDLTFRALGTPSEETWPEIKDLAGYRLNFPKYPPNNLSELFGAAGPDAVDLLTKMLVYNPAKRISIEDILAHNYFKNAPTPTKPGQLPFDVPPGQQKN
ncbi:cyclin-dependent kinase 7 [Nematocida homosporus]|uniref:cyclin-dependent kinase 7 n=1 Tax=Nematocida homosporus TaxID=1912981 RepID=UPI00221EB9C9|nr:cyclin-dependent kinase 7 [Nematocida homosporus]KAI5186245.1 cyclin-dependent kinase 7 [Nematocida homosporus]